MEENRNKIIIGPKGRSSNLNIDEVPYINIFDYKIISQPRKTSETINIEIRKPSRFSVFLKWVKVIGIWVFSLIISIAFFYFISLINDSPIIALSYISATYFVYKLVNMSFLITCDILES